VTVEVSNQKLIDVGARNDYENWNAKLMRSTRNTRNQKLPKIETRWQDVVGSCKSFAHEAVKKKTNYQRF
jgi:hypothetical protein